jgi:hypothetical protein
MVHATAPGSPPHLKLTAVVLMGLLIIAVVAAVCGRVVPQPTLIASVLMVFVLGDIAVRAVTPASALAGFAVMIGVNGWCMSVWGTFDDFSPWRPLALAAVVTVVAVVAARLFRFSPLLPSSLEPIMMGLMALSWVGLGGGAVGGVIALGFCVYDALLLFMLLAGFEGDDDDVLGG